MRVRIGVIAVLMLVVGGFPSSALACEKCTLMYDSLVKTCSSGHANGVQWCYGGFGTECTTRGTCGTAGGGGIGDDPFSPDYAVSVKPRLTCTGAEPDQGFVLDDDIVHPEVPAEK